MFHPISLALGRHPDRLTIADSLLREAGFTFCARLGHYVPSEHESPHLQHRRLTALATRLVDLGYPVAHFHHRPVHASCCTRRPLRS
ncbi:hypothetical protein GCM10027160_17020 [Streptomyces calidiresistens]|uniref:Uncharacterized protein n=1 Tax=Streptomyces calidiresistens TaxID=1485586 RepID=A0A7W3T0K1_9ACTN|nr:hypothetical protein [Streptomyces calidiresistens]MBB0228661.1 hypothetical protein [Streptomyces calidiresistens]